jgi:hypothetical protein
MEDDLQPAIESAFPEESDGNAVVNVDSVVSDIDIAGELESLSLESETAVLQQAADDEADEIATQLEQRLDVAPADIKDINFDFDVTSTLAFEQLRQLTQQQMQGVENTMSRIVRNTLLDADSIQEAKDNLSEGIAQMSDGHAETVARTQLNSADRHGVQALAESTDLIGGKQWHATEDGRERSWHLAMDGVTVDKDQQFVVPDTGDPKQPDGFPRQCNIVGGCDPYNCRCRQSSVLADDMEANVFELNRADNGVTVTLDITERQYEVAREHGEGDESFRDVFERILDENTVSEIGNKGIISTATLYKWKDALN